MGIWDILRKKIANEGESHHSQYEDTAAKNIYDIASFDMNSASLSDKIRYLLDNRSQGEQIQFADKLLREGPFEMSIQMYEALIQKYPEERDRYENGIGSAFVKLGQYDKAVEFYLKARSHGMHPDISDKHIWDASQKQYKNTGSTELLEKYNRHVNEGKYRQQVEDILKEAGVLSSKPLGEQPAPSLKPIIEVVEDTSQVENVYIQPSEPIEEVAKKEKPVAENQISLFGFDEPAAPEPQEAVVPSEPEPLAESLTEESLLDVEEDDELTFISDDDDDDIFIVRPNMPAAFDQHIDQFFDNNEVVVWADKRDDELRIDVYHIKPSSDRNFHLLLTCGMSRQPMNVPEGSEQMKYAELAAILPEDWDLTPEGMKSLNNYWPVLWLKNLARIPQQYNTWLSYGHSIPNGDPSKPIANTPYEGFLIMDSVTMSEDFQEVKVGNESLYIFTIVPVFKEEMHLKLEKGMDALLDAFSEAEIPDWIFPSRHSAV